MQKPLAPNHPGGRSPRFTICLPHGLRIDLEHRAQRTGKTMSQLVRDILADSLAGQEAASGLTASAERVAQWAEEEPYSGRFTK
jgi:plasmid stability protein